MLHRRPPTVKVAIITGILLLSLALAGCGRKSRETVSFVDTPPAAEQPVLPVKRPTLPAKKQAVAIPTPSAPQPSKTEDPVIVSTVEKDPVTEATADEAAAMGMDLFVERYQSVTKDNSEVGTREACYAYATLVGDENDRQSAQLPAGQRQQYTQAREMINHIMEAHFAVEDALGGGSIQLDFRASDTAQREDTLRKIIDSLQNPDLKDPAVRTQATKDAAIVLARARKALKPKDTPERAAEYRTAARDLQKATAGLQKILATLPDNAAGELAACLRGCID